LSGTPGDDYITGLGSNDFLYGLAGNDILDGGAGIDRLFGGAGADQFVLATGGSRDIIYDFEVGVDKIALAGMDYDDLEFEEYRGSGVEVIFGSDSLILRGVAVGEIDEGDFIEDFVAPVIDSMAIA
jgi:Ca2+-binding RTX toxin-like protein